MDYRKHSDWVKRRMKMNAESEKEVVRLVPWSDSMGEKLRSEDKTRIRMNGEFEEEDVEELRWSEGSWNYRRKEEKWRRDEGE